MTGILLFGILIVLILISWSLFVINSNLEWIGRNHRNITQYFVEREKRDIKGKA